MTLPAEEFIRRFLPHVLPAGFQRIRHFGLLANRHRGQRLAVCRQLLTHPLAELLPPPARCRRIAQALASPPPLRCPSCGVGVMIRVGFFPAHRWPAVPPADSS